MMLTLKAFLKHNQNIATGVVALAIIASIALGCNCGKGLEDIAKNAANSGSTGTKDNPFDDNKTADGIPGDELLNALVKETTADFAYAISNNDFTKIHEKASMDFQQSISVERMKTEFKIFVDRKSRYLPSLAKVSSTKAEFSTPPGLRTEQGLDILMTKGKFDTKPNPITFDYEYVKRDGRWKLLKLIVKM
jgi:hypothetical protein